MHFKPLMPEFSKEDSQKQKHTGFQSVAEDYKGTPMDLNKFLIKNSAATFFMRNKSNRMKLAGIFPEDILIVDRSLKPVSSDVVVLCIDNKFSVRRLHLLKNYPVKISDDFEEVSLMDKNKSRDIDIWGVVRCVLHFPKKDS